MPRVRRRLLPKYMHKQIQHDEFECSPYKYQPRTSERISEQRTLVPHVPEPIFMLISDSIQAACFHFPLIDPIVIPHCKYRKDHADHQVGQQKNPEGHQFRGVRQAQTPYHRPMTNVESRVIKVNIGRADPISGDQTMDPS